MPRRGVRTARRTRRSNPNGLNLGYSLYSLMHRRAFGTRMKLTQKTFRRYPVRAFAGLFRIKVPRRLKYPWPIKM